MYGEEDKAAICDLNCQLVLRYLLDCYKSRRISKRSSPTLRKTLFLIMTIYLQTYPVDEPMYEFLDKKRSEGKPYKVYMIAAAHKFLRIYYARIKEVMPEK